MKIYLQVVLFYIVLKFSYQVLEKNDIFDIYIGMDSLKKNKLNLNFTDDILYSIDKDNNPIELTTFHYNACLSICKNGDMVRLIRNVLKMIFQNQLIF